MPTASEETASSSTSSRLLDVLAQVERLSPPEREAVAAFVVALRAPDGGDGDAAQAPSAGDLDFRWRGALRDLKDDYTSVELQHEIVRAWESRGAC
jgi:hypothetical protein